MQNRRKFIRTALVAAGGATLAASPLASMALPASRRLTILHTNDLHSQIEPFGKVHPRLEGKGGLLALAGKVAQVRSETPDVLLLDAGDIFQSCPAFELHRGAAEIAIMNEMGYDAVALGNHDLDGGQDNYAQQLKVASFPALSANYDWHEDPLASVIRPYKILRRNGLKIGVYGLTLQLDTLVDAATLGAGQYRDPLEAALSMERRLKEREQCDVVVCVSHLGHYYDYDKASDLKIAPMLRFTDVIVGGHTHNFMHAPAKLYGRGGRQILVAQAGWGGLQLGRIDLDLNAKLDWMG